VHCHYWHHTYWDDHILIFLIIEASLENIAKEKVVEGTRERIQLFEGVVIRRRGGGLSETFTVRRVSYGVGVERTFLLHTPRIDKIEVVKRGRVRRARLYYLRKLRGKAARIEERR